MAEAEIEIKSTLKLAKMDDLVHSTNNFGDMSRNYGMPIWLVNGMGIPEGYTISKATDMQELKKFVEAERCYILKTFQLP